MREIPSSWIQVRFGEVNRFISRTLNPANTPDERFELYSVPSFPSGQPELQIGRAIGSTKQLVQPSDVLVCKINPRINRVWQVMPYQQGVRQIASSEWIVMRAPEMESRFLRYFFSCPKFRELICKDVTGVGGSLTRAQPKRVATFPVPVAPKNEQKRIADKLDAVVSRVDACRDRLDRVPAILKRFRQSVLAAATFGKLTEEWRVEHAEDLADVNCQLAESSSDKPYDLPDGWRWMPLAAVTTNFDGRRIPVKAKDRAKRQGPYKYYGAFGVIDTIDDFLFDGVFLLLAEDGKNLESRDRPISLVAEGKFWVNNHAHVLQPLPIISIQYLSYWINSSALDLSSYLTGIDQVKLTRGAMERIPVPIASLAEQAEIVRRVEALCTYADRLESRYTAARKKVECLTPALLAKAFRGDLVPQDPNDEPASVLLERIRTARSSEPVKAKRGKGSSRSNEPDQVEVDMLNRKEIQDMHLTQILKERGPLTAEALWSASQLDIDDFYDQLKDEEARGLLKEKRGKSPSASRLLEAAA